MKSASGNAFAFNRELVTDMGGQWTVLGQTAPAGGFDSIEFFQGFYRGDVERGSGTS